MKQWAVQFHWWTSVDSREPLLPSFQVFCCFLQFQNSCLFFLVQVQTTLAIFTRANPWWLSNFPVCFSFLFELSWNQQAVFAPPFFTVLSGSLTQRILFNLLILAFLIGWWLSFLFLALDVWWVIFSHHRVQLIPPSRLFPWNGICPWVGSTGHWVDKAFMIVG